MNGNDKSRRLSKDADGAAEDATLVSRVRNGEAEAFGLLVDRHQGDVLALARSLVRDAVETEDMCQEAFIRALGNIDLLSDPRKFRPWLRRIVFGTCVDWMRTFRPALFRGTSPHGVDALHSELPSAPARLERAEMRARVAAAVESLPEKYRAPIVLFHRDGLSLQRVADHLGAPAGTVKSWLHRARAQLKVILEESQMQDAIESAAPTEVFDTERKERALFHLTNGDSAAETLRACEVPGTVGIWAELLWDGPLPAGGIETPAWRAARADFYETAWFGAFAGAGGEMASGWDEAMEAHADYDEVVLWFEHDLFDQLLLIRHLAWYASRALGDTSLSLTCIGSFPGIEDFRGLGQLNEDEMASLFETRGDVSEEQHLLAQRAWTAFCSGDPFEIERTIQGNTSALPFLAAALRRFLEDLPDSSNGLTKSQRLVLESVGTATRTGRDLFSEHYERDQNPYLSSTQFFAMLGELESATTPLVEREGAALGMGETELMSEGIRITNAGRDVLAGRSDSVSLNGISRWLGPSHLTTDEFPWRWDRASGCVVLL